MSYLFFFILGFCFCILFSYLLTAYSVAKRRRLEKEILEKYDLLATAVYMRDFSSREENLH